MTLITLVLVHAAFVPIYAPLDYNCDSPTWERGTPIAGWVLMRFFGDDTDCIYADSFAFRTRVLITT